MEVLLTVVVPLLLLFRGSAWPLRRTIIAQVTIPILWYPTYAPLHELGHIVMTYAVGGTITSTQLIPPFWRGEFAVAWINSTGVREGAPSILTFAAPYILDVLAVIIGMLVLRRRYFRTPFVAGFALMLLCLRPLFDLVCEAIAYFTGLRGDLYHVQLGLGSVVTTTLVLLAIALSLSAVILVVPRLRPLPAQGSPSTDEPRSVKVRA